MTADAPFKPPRKKINVFWFIGGVFLLLVALFLFQLCGPNPPIEVSRETTYITEPLASDGLPDYVRYVVDAKRKGLTRENNAAVLMFQALGPVDVDPQEWARISKELGLPSEPEGPTLTNLYGNDLRARVKAWLVVNVAGWKAATAADTPDRETGMSEVDNRAEEAIDHTRSGPWRSDQFPPMAEWIRENRVPLDLLVEAAQRPRFWSPEASDSYGSLIGMPIHGILQSRSVARALLVDSMWHLGEGRHEAAWKDLLAAHRWARLVGQGDTLVEQLVAAAIDGMAIGGTNALLGDPNLPAALAKKIQLDLDAMTPASNVAKSFDGMERLIFLDVVVGGKREGLAAFLASLNYVGQQSVFAPFDYISVDWNVVLSRGNRFFDRLASTCALDSHAARDAEITKINAELTQLDSEFRRPGSWVGGALSPVRRSDMLAAFVIVSMASPIEGCVDAEDRANTQLELLRTAAALAVHRAENGKYPEKLDEIVPGIVHQLPVDVYNAKPFIYKRTADGYLLYSAGENGADDGGSHFDWGILNGQEIDDANSAKGKKLQSKIPAGADDISIRVPRPPFELPKVPQVPPAVGP